MKIHPISVIVFGLLLCSIGFNVLQRSTINNLVYKIQKLEAGPAQGIFMDRKSPLPKEEDKELNELLKRMIKQILKERMV